MKTINDLINDVAPMFESGVHALKIVVDGETLDGIKGIIRHTTITLERQGNDAPYHSRIDVTITSDKEDDHTLGFLDANREIEQVQVAKFTVWEIHTETFATMFFRALVVKYPELHEAGLNYDKYSTVISVTKNVTLSGGYVTDFY